MGLYGCQKTKVSRSVLRCTGLIRRCLAAQVDNDPKPTVKTTQYLLKAKKFKYYSMAKSFTLFQSNGTCFTDKTELN